MFYSQGRLLLTELLLEVFSSTVDSKSMMHYACLM